MAQGWISIHRQLQSHWLWDDKPFSRGQAWIDLLLMANHADNKFLLGNELIEVQTGSFITSIAKLCTKWGWSNTKVVKFLDLLENDGMITRKSDTKKTVITIEKYSDYQICDDKKTMQKRCKNDTKTIRKHTNNNDNNDNNENKIIYNADPSLNQAIIKFVEFRKSIKKPMTEHAVDLMVRKLQKMTPDIGKQIEIINQSILNGWQGIFPLKEEQKQGSTRQIQGRKEVVPDWMNKKNSFNNFEQRDYNMSEMERKLLGVEEPKTAGNDENVRRKAEELQRRLGASF